MIALGIIAVLIVLVTVTRVGIIVQWDGALSLQLTVGPIRFKLTPGKKKIGDKPKREKTTKSNKKKKTSNPWPHVLLTNWQELLELVGRVLRMPLLDPFILRVTFGGDDPADRAIRYGQAWALVGAVMPLLERSFNIGKRDIDVRCKPNENDISVYAKAGLSARIGQCFSLAIHVLRLFLRLYKQTKQTEKAVQMK